jgi:hypothetical protein
MFADGWLWPGYGHPCDTDFGAGGDAGMAPSRGIDIERHELAKGATFAERPQQQAGLGRGAAAELDQRLAPQEFGDLARARSQDRGLGPGRVVLGQPGDLLEQLAAALVGLAAVRDRGTQLGVVAGEIDDLVRDLRAAKGGGYEWASSPFFLDLTLRKPVTA